MCYSIGKRENNSTIRIVKLIRWIQSYTIQWLYKKTINYKKNQHLLSFYLYNDEISTTNLLT